MNALITSDWLRRDIARARAVRSVEHAIAYLQFSGDQWEFGEQLAATNAAIQLLRERVPLIWPRG